jgi:HEAT repeat protein
LHVVERGVDRNGGFALPIRADGHPLAHISQTPTLTFDVKSSSADPIGVVVSSHDRSVEYSLGRQSILGGWGAHLVAMPPATGGTWRKVSLDLRPLASAGQGDDVTGIEIRPTEAARRTGRILPDPIEIDLDNVRFTADSPTAPLADPRADATSGDPEERALFAAKAMESSPALVALLTDKSEFVRLNAAQAYSRVKDPAAQPNLLSDASDLDPAVSAAALRGIAFTGGPDAIATVRHAVRFGITPLARATAAEILGETKNPAFGDDIVSLIVDRSRLCRLASVAALAGLPGHENSVRRWAFIIQDDPEIKLAVTRTANPTEDNEVRKLLWSAVNEPSDLVRAESDVKLIQASDPAARSEGYKGVRDDSTTVRLYLLKYLEAHPAESHRAALRLAITDRSPRVRAEALLAFGALDKGAEPDEISNVMQDRDPGVELALIALSKKRGLKLSDQTRQLMVTSPDPRVKQALEGQ